eukprot:3682137-Alexandrium_andersonii.AAC.1
MSASLVGSEMCIRDSFRATCARRRIGDPLTEAQDGWLAVCLQEYPSSASEAADALCRLIDS